MAPNTVETVPPELQYRESGSHISPVVGSVKELALPQSTNRLQGREACKEVEGDGEVAGKVEAEVCEEGVADSCRTAEGVGEALKEDDDVCDGVVAREEGV